MKFSSKSSLVSKKEFLSQERRIQKEIINMNNALRHGYEDDRASINLCDDKILLAEARKVIREKSQLNPEYLIVIGIGGSNLGTVAVQEGVLGKLYNHHGKIKVLYSDTVDSDSLKEIIHTIEQSLKKGKNIIINGVSKSGSTTETIANFEILVNLLKKYKKNYSKYIVVTTNRDSNYWDMAKMRGFATLEIPKKVGGRYSVFSPVGLFPLGMLGININALLKGARGMRNLCLSRNLNKNAAAESAIIQYVNYFKGKNISDLFLFSNDLSSIGKWYRQLMGESIGKEFDINCRRSYIGITPTVSIGSTDLHSMAQLYLGGPYDKFTTFVKIENTIKLKVPNLKGYSKLAGNIEGKNLDQIMNAIIRGVKIAFEEGKRPFAEVSLSDKSEYSIGEFMQFKMMEMMYLGYLLRVNPFDQPNVESYKAETQKILKNKK